MTNPLRDAGRTVTKQLMVDKARAEIVTRKGLRLENIGSQHPRHSHHQSHLSKGHQLKGVHTDVLVYENRSGAQIAHFMGPLAVQLAVEFQNKQSYL